jgi:hypothetical protein
VNDAHVLGRAAAPAGLGYSRVRTRMGEPTRERTLTRETLRIRLTASVPSRVLLLEIRPDGVVTQAWPAPGAAPVLLVSPSPTTSIVQRLSHSASTLPGKSRLRLVVAPADLDLALASPVDLERAAPRLTLVDLTYETERP